MTAGPRTQALVGPLGLGVETVFADAAAALGNPDRYLSLLRVGG
ncbi:MAG: hypothetical protein ACOCW6_07485 [Spirochaetota bacterium]